MLARCWLSGSTSRDMMVHAVHGNLHPPLPTYPLLQTFPKPDYTAIVDVIYFKLGYLPFQLFYGMSEFHRFRISLLFSSVLFALLIFSFSLSVGVFPPLLSVLNNRSWWSEIAEPAVICSHSVLFCFLTDACAFCARPYSP